MTPNELDAVQAEATILGFRLAVVAGDNVETEHVLFRALNANEERFGYLAAATLRHVIDNVLAPLLDVTSELHRAGALSHDLRQGLADALANAEKTLGGGQP